MKRVRGTTNSHCHMFGIFSWLVPDQYHQHSRNIFYHCSVVSSQWWFVKPWGTRPRWWTRRCWGQSSWRPALSCPARQGWRRPVCSSRTVPGRAGKKISSWLDDFQTIEIIITFFLWWWVWWCDSWWSWSSSNSFLPWKSTRFVLIPNLMKSSLCTFPSLSAMFLMAS